MIELKNIEDRNKLCDDNVVLGNFPQLSNSKIIFRGKGNILFCESGVTLEDSVIDFNGDNGLVFLGKSRFKYKVNAFINNKCTLSIGRDNYINGPIHILLSEHKHFFVGSNCIFSTDITVRNSDAHLIYDINTMKRINPTKSIFLGDHVWIGKGVYLAKGTRISSGSIIGANSLISNKQVEHNASYAGNPARKIKEDIFWNGSCVHPWDIKKTELSEDYQLFLDTFFKDESADRWIYDIDMSDMNGWDDIDRSLDNNDGDSKISLLKDIYNNMNKNRLCFN